MWLLIRHGQTLGNVEKRYIGARSDVDLTPEGIAMAKKAAEKVKDLKLKGDEYYFVSPLKRAVKTASILFPDAELIKKDAFMEHLLDTLPEAFPEVPIPMIHITEPYAAEKRLSA